MSTRFPAKDKIYDYYKKWFIPNINKENCCIEIEERPKEKNFDNTYDMLPEYPPLRYLGLLSLEFAGFVEETLRYLYEEMLKLSEVNFKSHKEKKFGKPEEKPKSFINIFLIFKKLPNTLSKLFKLKYMYYKTKSLDYLSLPITRKYMSILINNKIQETIDENITRLTIDLFNMILLMLSILSLVGISIQFIQFIIKYIIK